MIRAIKKSSHQKGSSMSRKFACFFLAAATLLSSLVIVYADEAAQRRSAYEEAAAVLADSGMAYPSAATMDDGRSMALAVELGMLQQRSAIPLTQLSTQALLLQEEQLLLEQEEAQRQAQRGTYLTLYDAVLILTDDLPVYASPSTDASVRRTLSAGKVARLKDVSDGWFKISFGKTSGYVTAEDCQGVTFADYQDTTAVIDVCESLLDFARTWLGTPYVYGGSSHSGTDCSGFTMSVFAKFGYSLPHGAQGQYRRSEHVTASQRKAGDLVFFTAPGYSSIEHVGIYLGSGRFIHASSSSGVIVSSLYEDYYSTHYYGAGRILSE